MKKIITLAIYLSVFGIITKNSQAQFGLTSYVIFNNQYLQDTVYLCEGDSIQAQAYINNIFLSSNFNNAALDSFWISNVSCNFSNLCNPTNFPASGFTCWFGGNAYPRELESKIINLENTTVSDIFISWDMKYGANQNGSNCESPDEPSEGVHLMWKDINDTTWYQFPGIDILPSGIYGNSSYQPGSGGYWTPVGGNAATGPLYTWNHYKSQIPAAAMGKKIKIKFFQNIASGNTFDHWGLDNIEIKMNSSYYGEWKIDNIPVSASMNIPSHFPSFGKHYYVYEAVDLNSGIYLVDTVVVIVNQKPAKPIVYYQNDSLKTFGLNAIQWYYQNNLIPGAFQNYYIPNLNGSYSAVYTNVSGCKSDHSDPVIVYNVGIDENYNNTMCYISPNPVFDHFKINSNKKIKSTKIVNLNGVIIKHLQPENNINYNISELSDGMYFIFIQTDKEIIKLKLIKTH